MTRVCTFSRLWQEAYARERPVVQEAARLANLGYDAAPVELARTARRFVAAAAALDDAVTRADPAALRRHRRRAIMACLAEAPQP